MTDFDNLLDQINGFGPYQIIYYVMNSLVMDIFLNMNTILMSFAGAAPAWKCVKLWDDVLEYSNTTLAPNQSWTKIGDKTNCQLFEKCETLQFGEKLNSVVTEFRLYCDESWVSDSLSSFQFFGILLGAMIMPQMAELFGRKWVILVSYTLCTVTGVAMSFAPNWTWFGAGLFVIGFSCGGYWCSTFVMEQEITSVKRRTTIFILGGYIPSSFAFSFVQWYYRDWRLILYYCNCAALLLVIPFVLFVKESPRWLIQHAKVEEAKSVVRFIARVNFRPVPDMMMIEDIRVRCNKHGSGARKYNKKYSYWHLCSTKELTVHLIAMACSWFVTAHITFAITLNMKSLPGNRYVNKLASSCISVCGTVFLLIGSHYLGRRTIHQLSLSLMTLFLSITAVTYLWLDFLDQSVQEAIITGSALLGLSSSGPSWFCIYLYSAELFPTVIRPLANGTGSMAARIGGVLAPMVLYIGQTYAVLPYITWVGIALANLVVAYLFLPETKGQSLPDEMPEKSNTATERLRAEKAILV